MTGIAVSATVAAGGLAGFVATAAPAHGAPYLNCGAGGAGGDGGDGGYSYGGTGGIAINIPVFSANTGGAFASGGNGGSARGGRGGRGGSGVAPVCNQNTNYDVWNDDDGWDWG